MKRLPFILGIALTAVIILSILSGCPVVAQNLNNPSLIAYGNGGPAPLTVKFSMQEADDFLEFHWIFGDGTELIINDSSRMTHTYENPGTYYAFCEAKKPNYGTDDNDGSYCTVIVTEAEELAVTISADPVSGCPSGEVFEVDFTSTVTGGDLPYTYAWDFGDGSPLDNRENPTYYYINNPATYTVDLTVTDEASTVVTSNQITITICGGSP